jgi:hypothetical protein
MPASNTKDCFREFIGMKIKGVIFDALPIGDIWRAKGTKTLIFEDGRGLTISNNGSFWIENENDIKKAVENKRKELDVVSKEIQDVLSIAGES